MIQQNSLIGGANKSFDNGSVKSINIESDPNQTSSANGLVPITALSKIPVEPNYLNVDSLWINHLHYCHPRPKKDKEKIERIRTPWTFPISIWAKLFSYEYNGEGEEIMTNAFEYDFNRCAFHKDFKNEESSLEELKEYLRSNYNKIIIAYKNISSQATPIWQIGNSAILDFLNKSNGLLSQNYPQSFMNLKLQGVKSADSEESKKKNKNVPEGIIRHQFMNLLGKVAIDKYVQKVKQFKSGLEAIKYSFDNHYNNALSLFEDPQLWRRSRYYNEKCDNFIQAHLPILFAIYKSWATKKELGKREKFMTLDDFHNLCTATVNKECPVREIDLYFNQAIHLQENEIDYDRHYYLIFPEFIEAFCRVIDKASVGVTESTDLIIKLDSFKDKLTALIGNGQEFKAVKEKFIFPEFNTEINLYEFDNNSQFYRELIFPTERDNVRRSTRLATNTKDSSFQEKIKILKSNLKNDVADTNNLQVISEF